MKSKPSLGDLRDDEGSANTARKAPAKSAAVQAIPERENKTIRIRKAFGMKLREVAYHRTMAEGRRVTESDIIDEALDHYFALRK